MKFRNDFKTFKTSEFGTEPIRLTTVMRQVLNRKIEITLENKEISDFFFGFDIRFSFYFKNNLTIFR
ncbi:hypothetical protein LEP1GSC060_0134 [Leptospira weilii serovar Ranarum str. ICFT]|uniref:Uncharacterized protein n=1 Tax=Leptospira weilii serovar Ranarum str. ICFT TaxID=1218598 RepID=N1WKE6_9LEPT|nr:hypothetical protein LEP1GSC060_0134 [Leptospira weilii serovar Ranarum str. ICFT]